jgi:glutathione S-transferase
MMQLHARPASPFARKVRVAAIETGVIENIEILMAQTPEESRRVVPHHNPLSKIPVLVLEDGTSLYDSRVICEYIDTMHGRTKLFPRDGMARFRALRLQALGDGIGDAAALMGGEIGRPDNLRSDAAIARQWDKVTAACQVLEDDISQLDGVINIGQISVACGLGYADFRLTSHSWREGRPKLTAWIAAFNDRPAMKATYFARPK